MAAYSSAEQFVYRVKPRERPRPSQLPRARPPRRTRHEEPQPRPTRLAHSPPFAVSLRVFTRFFFATPWSSVAKLIKTDTESKFALKSLTRTAAVDVPG